MKFVLITLIKFYQRFLRKFHNRECIYTPSCSNYTALAIKKHGSFKGVYYGYMRIKRCNGALFQGGIDFP